LIYVDSSVLLARLLSEDRAPSDALFDGDVVASRLVEYEVWNRMHVRMPGQADNAVVALLAQVELVEMTPDILERALEPFPVHVRTLDALHLATMVHLVARRQTVELASYDRRLLAAAEALAIPAYAL
jgi:predicted nucleic acid-binding protein